MQTALISMLKNWTSLSVPSTHPSFPLDLKDIKRNVVSDSQAKLNAA